MTMLEQHVGQIYCSFQSIEITFQEPYLETRDLFHNAKFCLCNVTIGIS